ncbi:RNA helicase [Ranunculus cassubicifolius]
MEKRLATQGDDDILYGSFDSMDLKEDLLRGIYAYGYDKPSLIQQRGIVPFSKGIDLILQGKSGPTRISTYCIGILQQLDLDLHKCQCLVLASGSGEVVEIAATMRKLGHFLGVKVYACVERGDNISTDSHVIVGTPERIQKLMRKQILCSKDIKMVVLDEAKILMCFYDRIYEIIEYLPLKIRNKVQIGAFFETLPTHILQSITKMMRDNTLMIMAKNEDDKLSLDGIGKHKFVNVEEENLNGKALQKIIDQTQKAYPPAPMIVFVSSPTKLISLTEELNIDGYTVSTTRGCMDQKSIVKITREFLYKTGVLLTTRLWSRGIIEETIDQVRFIINYDLCTFDEEYIRELGWFRGVDVVINFATKDDWANLVNLQETYNILIERLVPSRFQPDFSEAAAVSSNKETQIKHFLCNAGNEEGKIDRLLLAGEYGLHGELTAAETSVIFVNSPEKVSWLVDKLELDSKFTVLTSKHNLKQAIDSTRPRVFIATDEEFDVKVKVHLVINFDIPLANDNYYRRLGWCRSNAIFLLFGTKVDWFKVLDMQVLYDVFITWIPPNAPDILGRMVITESSTLISKKARTQMHLGN